MEKKQPPRQFELSNLKNSTKDVILDKQLSQGFNNPVVKGVTDKINTKEIQNKISGSDFMAKINALKGMGSQAGKKVLGAIPLIGAATTFATTGDASAAAEEIPGDIPFLGQAYEAIRPETAGDVEGEKTLLAEIEAYKNYKNSPAHQARLQALKNVK
jgi:DNA polymerase/3'-5' exonuclease PolX